MNRAGLYLPRFLTPGEKYAKTTARSATLCFVALLAFLTITSAAFGQDEAKRLVSLLDYLGSDYKNAVKDGKILSQDEYAEMQEFSKRSQELLNQLKQADKADRAGIESTIKSLAAQIDKKAEPQIVAELAQNAKEKLITAYKIVPYPKQLPSLDSGKKLYVENCAQCHGESGKGDGPGRDSMNPKTPLPANFTDPERMAGLSPFKGFNTASFGVEGTAMASFAALSEEQRWQVAFYVTSLRFTREQAASGEALLAAKKLPTDLTSAATLATSSDEQLEEKLKTYFDQSSQVNDGLAFLRRGVLEKKPTDPLIVTRNLIGEAAELYAGGQKEKAYQKAVDAYIDGFELAEPALFTKDASFGRSLEGLFTQFRNAIKQGVAPEEIQKRYDEITAKLDQASEILARDDGYSGIYFFINSALIILREGLEATLVLAAILAMLKVMGASDAVRYIHLGWILALIAGGLTWVATQTFLTFSGQNRESMEGFISVFAAVALFYVGYWLHTRSEAKKWQTFIRGKVENVVSGKKILGLVGISFFAVYREAFEVVLFYQALWLQNESGHHLIVSGFVAGLAVLVVLTFAILKLGLKVPLKYFFGVTGTFLYIIAFIFAGNGIKELQAASWVSTTPVSFPPQVPLLGIYPTLQTLGAQGIMLCAFIMTSFSMARQRKRAE
ncbi:MAG: FTR1 family protein [Candidatus Binatia bacterium]|jgi:high-affinity iron transporter